MGTPIPRLHQSHRTHESGYRRRWHSYAAVGAVILVIAAGILSGRAQDVIHFVEQTYYRLQTPTTPTHHQSRVDVVTFDSVTLGQKRELKVYIPQEYDVQTTTHFPVLYMLHGDPGNDNDWLVNAHLQHTLDDLFDKHLLEPFLVVFPDGNGPQIKDGQYVDATAIKQPMATFISQDVVGYIDAHYRTQDMRTARAIGGISSGGYGAVNLLLHYPDVFGGAMSLSGYFNNREDVIKKLFGHDLQTLNDNNPLTKIVGMTLPSPTFFFLAIGNKDNPAWILEQTQMQKAAQAAGAMADVKLYDGGHGWGEWQQNIISALIYVDMQWSKVATVLPAHSPTQK